ncbi:hypothetical protein GCM10010156_65460 [Planobispora rosea]|uniref:Alcohol dehydrogenase n=1 Tax=Planobispora rosea TaxID=35762 RepID=A0A8J3S718_PLARO|nr:hypothetical protein [Planobispora rosea]GGS98183.1 hypothetical protein GCM10010156_65460 [Planobispora rosea]GIH87915.1 hypothetical protein Pro02_63230 [Planobispora rosea]
MRCENTCEICRAGYQSRCVHAVPIGTIGTQAQYARIPLADGTLVATPAAPEPDLIDLICNRAIDPGKVFDLTPPLEEAAEGYRAVDERRAVKALLTP